MKTQDIEKLTEVISQDFTMRIISAATCAANERLSDADMALFCAEVDLYTLDLIADDLQKRADDAEEVLSIALKSLYNEVDQEAEELIKNGSLRQRETSEGMSMQQFLGWIWSQEYGLHRITDGQQVLCRVRLMLGVGCLRLDAIDIATWRRVALDLTKIWRISK